MRALIRNIILFIYFLGIFSLIFSYASSYINPSDFWIAAFFSLAYPVFLVFNLVFLFYWILRKKWKYVFFSIIVLILGWQNIHSTAQINFSSEESVPENAFKLMSFNVRNFDLYNWTNNEKTRNKIFEYISSESPDVICFQEFYKDKRKEFKTLDTLLKFQKAVNYHEDYTVTIGNRLYFGIATFTKFPIINKGCMKFEESENICIYSDVLIDNDTVRIYNCHLESIHFDFDNYEFVDSLKFKINNKQIEGAKNIFSKLKAAFKKRGDQADIIAEHMESSPYRIILCGDFNDTPFSYAYWKIRGDLKDAFIESGTGFGKSYSGRIPSLRIDYIMHDESISSYNYKTGPEDLSDHSPISTWLFTEK